MINIDQFKPFLNLLALVLAVLGFVQLLPFNVIDLPAEPATLFLASIASKLLSQ